MSYSFNGTSNVLTGSMTSTYTGDPVTIAAWIKFADHPIANQVVANFGNSGSSLTDSQRINLTTTDNQFRASSQDSAAGASTATATKAGIDATWVPYIGVFTAPASRDVYISDSTANNTGTENVADSMRFISVGANLAGAQFYAGNIAEVAIWDVALDSTDIASYLAGIAASSINAAHLIGYWPLSASNSTQSNLGTDTGGDLSVSGATFDSDHPTISSGSGTTVTPNTAGMTF